MLTILLALLYHQLRVDLPPGLLTSVVHLNDLDRDDLLLHLGVAREVIGVSSSVARRRIELIVQATHLGISTCVHAPSSRLVVLERLCE